MNILGFVPARANSKGVPGKNIKLLNGKPLLSYTIEEGKKSRVNRLIVSTDSPEISELSQALGAEVPFLRPCKLSKDDSVIEDVIIDTLEKLNKNERYQPNLIVILQPTSPLRTAAHIDDCINLLEEKNADAVVSVSEPMEHPAEMVYWEGEGKMRFLLESYRDLPKTQRQGYPPCFFINGSVYTCRHDTLINKKSRFGDVTLPYVMRSIDSIDIDSNDDFLIAEAIFKARGA
jgi:CMP-N,N'-diacetyllegionaminic acid synthase